MNNYKPEVTAVTVAAAQSVAGAQSLDKPTPANKPRTAVGLPADSDRHYDLSELKACGFDAMAATVVHHIAYNTKRHKCAKAYTLPYWQSFFGGCSKQQARTAVKKALAAKINDVPLLEISHGYFAKVWSPHYLYVGPGVEINTPWDADINTPSAEGNQQKETKVKKDIEDSPAQKTGSAETSKIHQAMTGEDKSTTKPTPDAVVKPPKFTPKPGEVLHKSFRELQHQYEMPCTELGSLLHARDCDAADAIGYFLKQVGWGELQFAKWISRPVNWGTFDETVQPVADQTGAVLYPNIRYLRAHLTEVAVLYRQHLDALATDVQKKAEHSAKYAAEDAAAKAAAPKKLSKFAAKNQAGKASQQATQQPATPLAEVVVHAGITPADEPVIEAAPVGCHTVVQVVHVLTVDDYQECDEPPEYVKPDAFDHYKQEQARQKAILAKNSATMFQHGKYAKAALTH